MIHARSDYNRIQDPEGKIGQDEPVFLLRGLDRTAPATLRAWAAMQKNADMARAANLQADRMEQWQGEHTAKDADAPTGTLLGEDD